MVTWQEPMPLQSPIHPAKLEPLAGGAVRVTPVPVANIAVHGPPLQLKIPSGVEDTLPGPVPLVLTVREYEPAEKVAVTLCGALIVSEQMPMPEQSPDQPANIPPEPLAGTADKVTLVPLAKGALHESAVQLIPPGLEVTRPG